MNLSEVAKAFSPASIRKHPMMHDPISVAALAASVTLSVGTLLIMLVKVHKVDYPVPVHYLSLIGFDQVGKWYVNYRLAAFAIFVTVINSLLAAQSFQRNRLASFFLLLGAVTVSLLCLVIGLAFAVIT